MSNNNAPNGFSFVRNFVSASPTYQTSVYQIASSNSHSFGKGDIVKILSTGYIDRALTSDTDFLGVIDRVEYYDTVQNKKMFLNGWLAPSTALANSVFAYVIEDTNAVFGVQSGNGGPVTIASVGNNINFGANAAPNTSTGISTAYADFNTLATTGTLPFRIVSVPQNLSNVPTQPAPINNDSTSQYNYIEVKGCSWHAVLTTGI
jgi:hypothetical protein